MAQLSPEGLAKAGLAPGPRRLQDQHFEFRGSSARPEGSRPGHSRATDPSTEPQRVADLQGQLETEQDLFQARQREADQTIARAEHLRQRAEALQREFERLRERAAQLEFNPDTVRQEEAADDPGGRPGNSGGAPGDT